MFHCLPFTFQNGRAGTFRRNGMINPPWVAIQAHGCPAIGFIAIGHKPDKGHVHHGIITGKLPGAVLEHQLHTVMGLTRAHQVDQQGSTPFCRIIEYQAAATGPYLHRQDGHGLGNGMVEDDRPAIKTQKPMVTSMQFRQIHAQPRTGTGKDGPQVVRLRLTAFPMGPGQDRPDRGHVKMTRAKDYLPLAV